MIEKVHWKPLLISLGSSAFVSFLSFSLVLHVQSLISVKSSVIFPISAWLMFAGWMITLILMAVAVYIVSLSHSEERQDAIHTYILQFFLLVTWPFIFYCFQAYLLAFLWLLIVCYLVLLTTLIFYQINRTAGILMAINLVWLIVMVCLNFNVTIRYSFGQ